MYIYMYMYINIADKGYYCRAFEEPQNKFLSDHVTEQ